LAGLLLALGSPQTNLPITTKPVQQWAIGEFHSASQLLGDQLGVIKAAGSYAAGRGRDRGYNPIGIFKTLMPFEAGEQLLCHLRSGFTSMPKLQP
jgi:hypothetical protein